MVRSYYLYDKSISFLYEVYKIPPPLLGLHIKFQTFLVSDLKRSLASKFGLVELSPPPTLLLLLLFVFFHLNFDLTHIFSFSFHSAVSIVWQNIQTPAGKSRKIKKKKKQKRGVGGLGV